VKEVSSDHFHSPLRKASQDAYYSSSDEDEEVEKDDNLPI
jgi:hypothetical protein